MAQLKPSTNNRNMLLGIGIIMSFIFLALTVSMYYNYQHDTKQSTRLNVDLIDSMSLDELKESIVERQNDTIAIPSFYFLPFFAFLGIIVGLIVYYIMSEKIFIQEKSLDVNTRIILKFLNKYEQKVIDTLISSGGSIPQYELSRLPDLNKVKTHRILENLKLKGIIEKERYGKINKIVLNKELYAVLKR
ncbi:MAG: hypothetical protein K0B02_02660 [DPANN group archaeon]|nr:hypothetical protein [DPANN group archaeon]